MFMELMESRRSIRKYQNREVETEKIDQLIEAALRAPSSRAAYPWRFIVVTDKDLLEGLAGSKPLGSAFLKDAPLGIVVLGNPEECDVWIEDCSIVSGYLHLAAHALGLGSCWIQIRERMYDDAKTAGAQISELLGIPAGMAVLSIIAIGYPDETKEGYKKEKLHYAKVFANRFGDPWKAG